MGDGPPTIESQTASPPRLNALIMDGGGVRGLSSLLILQRLIADINVAVRAYPGYNGNELTTHDIFGFAAGTSTGGLIAIMLTRLGMSVEECIQEYQDLSQKIFRKNHLRGRSTGGLSKPRYHGSALRENVKKLLQRRRLPENELLTWNQDDDQTSRMHCSVVCREHKDKSKSSDLHAAPVHLCSISCGHDFECRIFDAARATSAAWTYFPLMKIGEHYFSDGGVEFNNASETIWRHYTQSTKAQESRSRWNHSQIPQHHIPTHQGVDFSNIRIVNIGTGSNVDGETPAWKREKFAALLPHWIRFGLYLKRTLGEVATASERISNFMKILAEARGERLLFDRLSATNGVCWIKLDKYMQLNEITRLTNEWLGYPETRQHMSELANDMAREYLTAHPEKITTTAAGPHETGTVASPNKPYDGQSSNNQTASSDTTAPEHDIGNETSGIGVTNVPELRIQPAQSSSTDSSNSNSPPQTSQHLSQCSPPQQPPWLSTNTQTILRSQSV